MARREWTDEERRARLVRRHRLGQAFRAPTAEAVVASLVAVHSTDPATVFLSVAARLEHDDPVGELERALYTDRSLIRMHGMRKTIFVFPAALQAVVHASTTKAHAEKGRAELVRDLPTGHPDWDEPWLAALEADVLAYLAEAGEASGTAISTAVPHLRQNLLYAAGTPKETPQGLASRVLRSLGSQNRIVRGRPLGTWISGQYRWSIAPALEEVDPVAARSRFLEAWLGAYGPATMEDMKWWTGWAQRNVKAGLAGLATEEVQVPEGTAWVLAGDAEPDDLVAEDLVLLPGLDSTSMGYRQRNFYLDPSFVPALFDRAGNIGPTIWWGGRIVGVWAQRKDGAIATRWLATVPAEAETALEREIARLRAWVGEIRVTPRFRTPLERELAGS